MFVCFEDYLRLSITNSELSLLSSSGCGYYFAWIQATNYFKRNRWDYCWRIYFSQHTKEWYKVYCIVNVF